MTISKNIIKLREKHQMSKEDFCELIGINRRTLERWESGERVPEIKYIKAIVDNFYISDLYKFMFSDRFEKARALTQVKPLKKKVGRPKQAVATPEKVIKKPKAFVIPKLVYI